MIAFILPISPCRRVALTALSCVVVACGEREDADKLALSAQPGAACTTESLHVRMNLVLATMHSRNPVPGVSAAVFLPRLLSPVAATIGVSALTGGHPLTADDRFLTGSVGKTFFAAMALRRAADGRLPLDAPIRALLADTGIPAFGWITTRMLLTHTTGIPEYDTEFMTDLVRHPLATRGRDHWLSVLRRTPPKRSATGQFRYSDLNYVVLAMVLDANDSVSAYQAIETEFLHPLALQATAPSTSPTLPHLVTGYDGAGSMFGRDEMLTHGTLIYNPQFEWGGGGFISTPTDLSRWMAAFRNGEAFPDSLWPAVIARPAGTPDSAREWRGMGVHVGRNALGMMVGHSGYMPGYVSWVRWYDSLGVSVAMQLNATDSLRLRDDGFEWLDSLARATSAACGPKP